MRNEHNNKNKEGDKNNKKLIEVAAEQWLNLVLAQIQSRKYPNQKINIKHE